MKELTVDLHIDKVKQLLSKSHAMCTEEQDWWIKKYPTMNLNQQKAIVAIILNEVLSYDIIEKSDESFQGWLKQLKDLQSLNDYLQPYINYDNHTNRTSDNRLLGRSD